MGVTGDFAGLSRLAADLRALPDVRKRTAIVSAAKIKKLVKGEFAAGAGPDGEPWAPLRRGGAAHLVKTGATRASLTAYSTIAKITTAVLTRAANFHASGTRYMPARPILPTGAPPPTWIQKIKEAADVAVARALRSLKRSR